MNKNTSPAPTKPLPLLVVWAITAIATAVAVAEVLAEWFRAIHASKLSPGRKLAHGVAAIWVTAARAVRGVRSLRPAA